MKPRAGRAGVLAILARPQARKLCAAALTSSLAAWTAQVALLVGVLRQHAGSDLAWVLLAATVPALAAGTPAGAIVDRHDARRIAQITSSGAVLLLAATGGTLTSTLAAGTACYALFLVSGRFADPASLRLLYATLPPSQRAAGNAALGTATGITTVIGAAIGAAGVSTLGTGACFGLAAGLQAIAAGILWTLAPARTRTPPPPGQSRPSFRRSLDETLTALRRYPLAASIITVGIAWGLIGGSYDVLLGIYGTHLLRGGGGASVGVLYAADGAGVLAGSLLAAHLPARLERGGYALAYGLQGALWAAFAVSGSLFQAVPTLLAMRVASGVIIALDTTLLLATVPDHLHGRVYSAHAATYGAVMRVSLALTGALLLAVSPRAVTLGAGLASVLVGTAWWLLTGRSTRRSGLS
jgi:MFS family permease